MTSILTFQNCILFTRITEIIASFRNRMCATDRLLNSLTREEFVYCICYF